MFEPEEGLVGPGGGRRVALPSADGERLEVRRDVECRCLLREVFSDSFLMTIFDTLRTRRSNSIDKSRVSGKRLCCRISRAAVLHDARAASTSILKVSLWNGLMYDTFTWTEGAILTHGVPAPYGSVAVVQSFLQIRGVARGTAFSTPHASF